jgi:hypothetical protein
MPVRTRYRSLAGQGFLESWSGRLGSYRYRGPSPSRLVRNEIFFPGTWTRVPIAPPDRSREVTSDVNHKIRDPRSLRQSRGDVGGTFDNVKIGIRSNPSIQILGGNYHPLGDGTYSRDFYEGHVFATNPANIHVNSTASSFRKNLKPIGTTLIARCKPTNAYSNLAEDLADLRQGLLPKAPGWRNWEATTKKAAAKEAAGDFVGFEFGWLPLVSDVQEASKGVIRHRKILDEYYRNSGKPLRRSSGLPDERTVTTTDLGPYEGFVFLDPNMTKGFVDGTKPMPRLIKTTTRTESRWFVGSFTYHLPMKYINSSKVTRWAEDASALFGIDGSPDTLYKLSPWSWAIDWFSNLGDVIDNLSDWASDGLVLNYGYVMERIIYHESYFLDKPCRLALLDGGYAHAEPITVVYESQRRDQATPFGFETSWNNLSPRQWAISIALGIQRVF